MKQFSLEEYLKNPSRKVVTGDGSKVRIICTDAKINSTHPIIALVEEPNGRESIVPYTDSGQFFAYTPTKKDDLFFASEKHEGWINIYPGSIKYGGEIYGTENDAKNSASSDVVATIKIEWEE